jgi:four helix bundle protein
MKKKRGSKSFEDLECWKACREARNYIAELVKTFPHDERFRLVNQMIRAARSSTHNMAEGFGRFHYQENIQFCRQSRGSLFELKDQRICSFDEKFIEQHELDKGSKLIEKAVAFLNGYNNYLNRCKEE